jgi:DNA-directed RNA polymerase sigma subunit (sigma70/sigma32)
MDVPTDIEREVRLQQVASLLEDLEEQVDQLHKEREHLILNMAARGTTYVELGRLAGISRQRVAQIVGAYRDRLAQGMLNY